MNVLFLTLLSFDSLQERSIYTDLLREFVKNGHQIYAVSPTEKKQNKETHLVKENNAKILCLQIGNIQKTNILEKGISTVMIEQMFKKAIKKYFFDVKFDLILYSTPPITFVSAIDYVKNRDSAKTYLMLKDIFPQNAVDMGMMRKTGIRGLLYTYFRRKEKELYNLSDKIGCMSPANVEFVLKYNPSISSAKVEVCPNCIEPVDVSISEDERVEIRMKYNIPIDKRVFVYGGNLGKPQGIHFLIECLKSQAKNEQIYFLVVGNGTEYGRLEAYISENKPQNVKLMKMLPKEDYDRMVAACDVGMIFLDYRFTIPNFPSRLLSYMQAKLPVLCVTDHNTDIGSIAVKNGFGWWCESNDIEKFSTTVEEVCHANMDDMGSRAWNYMKENYTVDLGYEAIVKSIGGKNEWKD